MDEIISVSPNNNALSAEHYQNFEMAKQNDTILGGDDIAAIRSYAAFARARAQAIHKTISTMNGIEDVAAVKSEALETSQTFAKVSVYADQRIGEILRELPKAKGNQYQQSANSDTSEKAKADTLKESGISKSQAYDLQKLAANPEVVQAVIDKATEDGTVVSRSQVLKAIKERDEMQKHLDDAVKESASYMYEAQQLKRERDDIQLELNMARKHRKVAQDEAIAAIDACEQLKEEMEQLRQKEPEVVERTVEVEVEVEPEDYRQLRKRIEQLEHLKDVHSSDNQKLRQQLNETRQELYKARDILGMSEHVQDIRRDVQYLITATNGYIKRYGGLTWTAQSLADVDEPTREELAKAVKNLATFSSALVASLEEFNERNRIDQ